MKYYTGLILVGLIMLLIVVIGCAPATREQVEKTVFSTIVGECTTICTSHNWNYTKFTSGGYGPMVCYCTDSTGAIWPMPM
jgi:hypothetical protein